MSTASEYVVVALLTPDLKRVATDQHYGNRQLFSDSIDASDAYDKSVEEARSQVAYRVLREKLGFEKSQVSYLARAYSHQRPLERSFSTTSIQHTFVAILEDELELPQVVPKQRKVSERRFVAITDALNQFPLISKKGDQLFVYHAIALIRCLIHLQSMIDDDPQFVSFHKMISEITVQSDSNLRVLIHQLKRAREAIRSK